MSDSSPSEITSPSLLSRARGSDVLAWEQLVKLYSPLVYFWCRQSGIASHDAADIMQEVFQSVFRSLKDFDRAKNGAFRAWLWTITRNKIRNTFRRVALVGEGGSQAQERWMNLPEQEPELSDSSNLAETKQSLLHRALEIVRVDFKATTWQAFELMVINQRPASEVAKDLGLSIGAVYKARDRVLRRLNEELGDILSLSR